MRTITDRDFVLITGASGFLGTWLANDAHERGFGLLGIDIAPPQRAEIWTDFRTHLSERADFAALVGTRRLHAVFHLAGGASVPQSLENPIGDFASLLPGTIALLVYLARHQPGAHLVFFSSAAVYGNPARLPVSEMDPVAPISPYGIHKATAEFAIEHYARLFGLRASLLRIFSAYGEGLRKQVVWDTCQKVLVAMANGARCVPMFGSGNETRDFIHASDIARAALIISNAPPHRGTQVFNVASGRDLSIRTLAESVVQSLDASVSLAFDGAARRGDPLNWQANIDKLTALGFSPAIPFDEGIRRSINWQKRLRTTGEAPNR